LERGDERPKGELPGDGGKQESRRGKKKPSKGPKEIMFWELPSRNLNKKKRTRRSKIRLISKNRRGNQEKDSVKKGN